MHYFGGVDSLKALEDEKWMRVALSLADEAAQRGEVPVGAVIVFENEIVGRGGNRKEELLSPTSHAELIAIEEAAKSLKRWRLSGCSLYVTLEPCVMCSGAIIHSRLDRLVYAAPDPKTGAVDSLYQILADSRLNHRPEVLSGVMRDEASSQLKTFFRTLRLNRS